MRPLLPRWLTSRGQTAPPANAEQLVDELFDRQRPTTTEADNTIENGSKTAGSLVVVDAIPARRLVVPDPLVLIGGVLHMRLGDGRACPLRHGNPHGLNEGWSAPVLYVGCDRLLWLSLLSQDRLEANWFFDEAATFIASAVLRLPQPILAGLVRHVRDLMAMPAGAARDVAMHAYGQMPLETRQHIELLIATEDDRTAAAIASVAPLLPTMRPRQGPLTLGARLDAADFGRPGLFAGAWHQDQDRLALLAGQTGLVTLSLPYRPAYARLSLDVSGTAFPRLLTVAIGGWTIGSTRIGPEKILGSRLDYWIPAEALETGRVVVSLTSSPPPAEPATVLTLDHLTLDLGPEMPDVAPDVEEGSLMAMFESIGTDCEFGFVQRHFGIEPLGLFRFSGAGHLRNLLRLLENDLDGLGDPGSLTATLREAVIYRLPDPPLAIPEFGMFAHAHGVFFHTFRGPEQETETEALIASEQKLRYLKRKLIEDLEDAEKILLLKDIHRCDINEAFAFLDVLNRKGPNKLFWVTPVVTGRPSGSVEWIGPNLLRGYSGGPHRDQQIFETATWLRLCRNAARAFAERAVLEPGSRAALS